MVKKAAIETCKHANNKSPPRLHHHHVIKLAAKHQKKHAKMHNKYANIQICTQQSITSKHHNGHKDPNHPAAKCHQMVTKISNLPPNYYNDKRMIKLCVSGYPHLL